MTDATSANTSDPSPDSPTTYGNPRGDEARAHVELAEPLDDGTHVLLGHVTRTADSLTTFDIWFETDNERAFRVNTRTGHVAVAAPGEEGNVIARATDVRYGESAEIAAGEREGLTSRDFRDAFDAGDCIRIVTTDCNSAITGTVEEGFGNTIDGDDGERYAFTATYTGANPRLWRIENGTKRTNVGRVTHVGAVVYAEP